MVIQLSSCLVKPNTAFDSMPSCSSEFHKLHTEARPLTGSQFSFTCSFGLMLWDKTIKEGLTISHYAPQNFKHNQTQRLLSFPSPHFSFFSRLSHNKKPWFVNLSQELGMTDSGPIANICSSGPVTNKLLTWVARHGVSDAIQTTMARNTCCIAAGMLQFPVVYGWRQMLH